MGSEGWLACPQEKLNEGKNLTTSFHFNINPSSKICLPGFLTGIQYDSSYLSKEQSFVYVSPTSVLNTLPTACFCYKVHVIVM
jgi:hypothetical protein